MQYLLTLHQRLQLRDVQATLHSYIRCENADSDRELVRCEGRETALNNTEMEKQTTNFSIHHSKPLCFKTRFDLSI